MTLWEAGGSSRFDSCGAMVEAEACVVPLADLDAVSRVSTID